MGLFQSVLPGPGPMPKCHLPTAPVTMPDCRINLGSVGMAVSMRRAASPGAIPVPGLRQAYWPVKMA